MKKKWLFLIEIAVIITLTLLPLNFLDASPLGTTLILTKGETGSSMGYLTWSIKKSVDNNSFDLVTGQTTTANYTVNVTPTYHETGMSLDENIHIQNAGGEVAYITYVIGQVEYKVGSTWYVLKTKYISGMFTIPVGGSSDISYNVSFTPLEGVTDYRNVVHVGLSNYAIPGGGIGSYDFTSNNDFSTGGTVTTDAFADVTDSLKGYLGKTWVGDPTTYTYTYSISIGPYSEPGDYTIVNTATITGTDTKIASTDSLSIAIYVSAEGTDVDSTDTKGDTLINSGIPGKGLNNAPGQQKPFNPKSQAPVNAGMKK